MATLQVPARLEHLADVNTFLHQHLPADYASLQQNLELVAEELLVNVFSYAYPDGTTGKAEVECYETTVDGSPYLCFCVKDWGDAFDPFTEVDAPDLELDTEARPIGGLGIYLIKSLTALQKYTREDNSNVIQIYFAKPTEGNEGADD